MKKIFIIFLILFVGLLVGCASKPTQNVSKDLFYFPELYKNTLTFQEIDENFQKIKKEQKSIIDNLYYSDKAQNDFTWRVINDTDLKQYICISFYLSDADVYYVQDIEPHDTLYFTFNDCPYEKIDNILIKTMSEETNLFGYRGNQNDFYSSPDGGADFSFIFRGNGQTQYLIPFWRAYYFNEILKTHSFEFRITDERIKETIDQGYDIDSIYECKFITPFNKNDYQFIDKASIYPKN